MGLIKRKAITLMTAVLLFTQVNSVFASDVFHQKVESQRLSRGVTQEHIQRFSKDGWLNANVLYVDLTDTSIGLDFLQSSNGLTTKETVSSMAKKKENVIGAINADFFYVQNPDSPMGVMIKDGKMISNPVMVNNFASLYVTTENSGFANYLTAQMKLITDKGKEIEVKAVNKITWQYRSITVIDRNWGTMTPGSAADRPDHVEVIVVNHQVVEVRKGQPAVEIPQDGFVIYATGEQGAVLENNLQVGDMVELKVTMTPDIEGIKFAIGGGTLLVKDGQVVSNFTQDVSGNHPRTAVGITKDRKQLILVAVDGRHTSYKGLNGANMAKLMIELGSYEAIMMDGGGSTTMVTRPLGEFTPTMVTTPSDGSERRVINGLAVVSTASSNEVGGILGDMKHPYVFVNTPKTINIKAYDTYYNPLVPEVSQISLAVVQGKGTVSGNQVIPQEPGEMIVEVSYQGAKTQVKLQALDTPAYLEVTPGAIQLAEGGTRTLTVKGVSALGYQAEIDVNAIQWKDLNGLGTVSNGVYTAGNRKGESILEGKLGDAIVQIPVSIGTQEQVVDSFNQLTLTFSGYPQAVTGGITLTNNGRNGGTAVTLNYDFTQGEGTRAAYMNYGDGALKLPGTPNKIGIWVYSDAQSTQWIRGRIVDANGKQHVLDWSKGVDWTGWKYLEATVPTEVVAPVKLDRIYVAEIDEAQKVKGTLTFDDLQVSYAGSSISGVTTRVIKDPLYRKYDQQGSQFLIHSGVKLQKETLLDRVVVNNLVSKANRKGTQAIFTGAIDEAIAKKITNSYLKAGNGYSKQELEGLLLLSMDNSKNGFRATDFNQWPWLKQALENNKQENIILLLPKPITGKDGFTDTLEAELLMEMLNKQVAAGRNVFVIYPGSSFLVEVKDGIRYITTGAYNSAPQGKMPSEANQYVEFNLTGKTLTYQIKSIFE